jgi:predicted GTPase
MPYGDLEAMRVQRFATLADIDASSPTLEEREEYEEPVRAGMVVYAGVDYGDILRQAEDEADVIIWDGGNNDWSFYRPDVLITVVDPLRMGHESLYHPGEVNVRSANIIVVNKVDSASPEQIEQVVRNIRALRPEATTVLGRSPVSLEPGPAIAGRRVIVVEDGPSVTQGGMAFGAGTVAARAGGAGEIVDPRGYAVGSIADTYAAYPHIGPVLPAMGYGDGQVKDLAATIQATECDIVISAAPMDLSRVIDIPCPIRRVRYELDSACSPTLGEALLPFVESWRRRG